MRRTRLFGAIIALTVLVIVRSSLLCSNGEGDSEGSVIFGEVRDSTTQLPLKGVMVKVDNGSEMGAFYTSTDEDGQYQIRLSISGALFISFYSEEHLFHGKMVFISSNDTVRVDAELNRPPTQVCLHLLNERGSRTFEGANITINSAVTGRTIARVKAGIDGWANLTLEPGNYTAIAEWGYFFTATVELNIGNQEKSCKTLFMNARPANEGSNNIFLWDTIKVPPHHVAMVRFGSTDQYSLHCSFVSDGPVTYLTTGGSFIDEVLNWTLSGNGRGRMPNTGGTGIVGPAHGGGSSILTWTDPFCLLFVNDGNDTVHVSYELRYEFGEFTDLGTEIIPMDGTKGNDEDFGPVILFPILFLVLLGAIIVFMVYLYFLDRPTGDRSKVRSERKYNSRRIDGPIRARPEQGRARSR